MNKILLVDDDRLSCEALAATLRILGYTVETALDGRAAATRAAGFQPEVAIVDLNLPGVSGLEIVRHLSALPCETHCILATGMPDFALLKRALAAGAWTLMGKPFELVHLNAILQTTAVMTTALQLSKSMRESVPDGMLMITRRGDTPVNSEDVARAIRFAERCGADADTAQRLLPIVVYELLANARTFGCSQSSEHTYRLLLQDSETSIDVLVADDGRGFGWNRELTRARSRWDKSKAGGLQLISALCSRIGYSEDEFTAAASVSKVSVPEHIDERQPSAGGR